MLGNLEDLRDFHKRVMLPRMEEAMEEPGLVRKLFQGEQHKLMRSVPVCACVVWSWSWSWSWYCT